MNALLCSSHPGSHRCCMLQCRNIPTCSPEIIWSLTNRQTAEDCYSHPKFINQTFPSFPLSWGIFPALSLVKLCCRNCTNKLNPPHCSSVLKIKVTVLNKLFLPLLTSRQQQDKHNLPPDRPVYVGTFKHEWNTQWLSIRLSTGALTSPPTMLCSTTITHTHSAWAVNVVNWKAIYWKNPGVVCSLL